MKKQVGVLVVDDSASARELISYIINSDPALKVIGTAENGEEALRFICTQKPDVITMDIVMPVMDGFKATKQIMQTTPIPIVIVSSSFRPDDIDKSFRAINAGSVAILEKPQGFSEAQFNDKKHVLIETIKTMSEVKLVTRHSLKQQIEPPTTVPIIKQDIKSIVIGTSLGGPQALYHLLKQLSPDFAIPIFIVQHISSGFVYGFADWLNDTTPLNVKLATHGYEAKGGDVIIAPDLYHLEVSTHNRVILSNAPPKGGIKPAVSHLFRSVAQSQGKNALGIILTGMGHDGAEELLLMRQKGAVTIAQEEKDCTIFGMPKEAIIRGAAQHIASLDTIAKTLNLLTQNKLTHSQ